MENKIEENELDSLFASNPETILGMLDGDVQSQGIKIGHRDWLDMGSVNWSKTPDIIKSAAYQTAQLKDWSDNTIKSAMLGQYKHLNNSTIDLTLESLKNLAKEHPLEVIENYKIDLDIKIKKHDTPETEVVADDLDLA